MEGDGSIQMVVLALGILVAAWCGWRVLDWIWLTPKKLERILKKQGFTVTPFKLLFGDMFEIAKIHMEAESKPIKPNHAIVERVAAWNNHIIQKNGKKSVYWLGNSPMVHILDPGLANAILSDKTGAIRKPELDPVSKMIAFGVFNYEGEKWSTHRRLMNPAFHVEKLKFMSSAITVSLEDLVNKWDKVVPTEGCCELDVWPYIDALSADVISRTLFGSSYQEGKRIFQIQHEQAELVTVLLRSIYLPGFRFLPTTINRKMKQSYEEVRSLLRDLINSKEKTLKAGEAKKDLLSVLLESYSQDGGKITIDEVIENCKLFHFAGQETIAVLLTWTMVVLSLHPEWQVRAREEVFQVFGNQKPHWDGLNQLKLIPMILLEVLRLYPPAAILFRYTNKEFKHGDTSLPAGVQLVLPAILLHHSREHWGNDADEFNPERFSEGVAKATNNKLIFYPFGWGPRLCIGQQFAMIEGRLALSTVLQSFSFELSPSYTHTPANIIALRPQQGVHLKLRKV